MQVRVRYNRDTKIDESVLYDLIETTENPKIFFTYFTDDLNPEEVHKTLKKYLEPIPFVGACVPGFIVNNALIKKGIMFCVLSDPFIKVCTHMEKNISKNPFQRGERVGEALLPFSDSGTIFLFPDGFASNISELLRGMHNILGEKYNYVGGGTGDNLRFHKTYQLTNQGIESDALALALISGAQFKIGTDHGWEASSSPTMVTRARGKSVYELDGVPAFKRYSEILGGIKREDFPYYGMMHPFGIPSVDNNFLIRDPIMVNDDDSITFVTEVPNKSIAVIMKGNIEHLIHTSKRVTRETVTPSSNAAFLFNCVSRYLLMKGKFNEELDIIYNGSCKVPLTGILSFGEISSISGVPLFYNKTMVIIASQA